MTTIKKDNLVQTELFGKTPKEIDDAIEKANNFPDKWDFVVNKRFVGKLIKIGIAVIENENREYCNLFDDSGKEWTIWLGKVLKTKFDNLKVKENDILVIDYLGKKSASNKKYNDYNDYNVAVL
jgi:hypothetical protein